MPEPESHPYRPEDLRWIKPGEPLNADEMGAACQDIESAKQVLFLVLRGSIAQLITEGTLPANTDIEKSTFVLNVGASMSTRERFMPVFRQQIGGITRYWQITFLKNEKGIIDFTRPHEIIDSTDVCEAEYNK